MILLGTIDDNDEAATATAESIGITIASFNPTNVGSDLILTTISNNLKLSIFFLTVSEMLSTIVIEQIVLKYTFEFQKLSFFNP